MEDGATTTYLFAGDGLTAGTYGETYVARVARVLEGTPDGLRGRVVNAGRGGDTVRGLLSRIDPLLDRHVPDWVVLAVGTNDVWHRWLAGHSIGWWAWLRVWEVRTGVRPAADLDAFSAGYRALIERVQARRGVRVLACTVSPIGERLSSPINQQLARLNGAIQRVAVDCDVPVADVWLAFVEQIVQQPRTSGYLPQEWLFAWLDRRRLRRLSPDRLAQRRRLRLTFDGLHLNSRGADLWAATILQALPQTQGVELAPRSPLGTELSGSSQLSGR